jgi:trimethylamine--corrinoid protein Co-methyltransferase
MKTSSAPMAAIEALQLDVAYVNVARSLGCPTQSYMALSDGKFLDAQAGAETFGGALLAALAGINSVSGPGMLDYVMVFSLEKLILDDELCGQALHFVSQIRPLDDLPTVDLVRELLAEGHYLTAPHTLKHWPEALYLPGPPIDRTNREDWGKLGRPTLQKLAKDEVDRRLAAYAPVETETEIESELRRLIQDGMVHESPLPHVPSHVAQARPSPGRRRRRHRRRR